MFDDSADFLSQVGEDSRQGAGDIFLQTQSLIENFKSTMTPETARDYENLYAQTRDGLLNWLAQVNEPEKARIGEMLSQTSYGNYFMQQLRPESADQVSNFFAQQDWSAEPAQEGFAQVDNETEAVADEELEEFAEILAQLTDEQM